MTSLSPSAKEQIQTLLSKAVESKRAPGLIFGATNAKEELYFTHAGPRVFNDPSGGRLTDDSVFWICSQTKLMTSIAALQLVEQGKIQLDSPVHPILPELANPVVLDSSGGDEPGFKPAQHEITLRQLLNHSSGLYYHPPRKGEPPDGLPFPLIPRYDKSDPVSHFCNVLKGPYPGVPLKFEPGSNFAYGYSSDFLGFLIERLSGESLEQYFKKHIFLPLGMMSASFYLMPTLKDRTIQLSCRGADGEIVPWADQYTLIEQDPSKVHLHIGGGGVYSSLKDYLTLLRHLLQIQVGSATNPVLRAESVGLFFEPSLTGTGADALNELVGETDSQFGCGLCVNTMDRPGKRRKGSGWWYGWANTYHFLDPETGVALVFGSQLLPTRDAEILKLWDELELVFYNGLVKQ